MRCPEIILKNRHNTIYIVCTYSMYVKFTIYSSADNCLFVYSNIFQTKNVFEFDKNIMTIRNSVLEYVEL